MDTFEELYECESLVWYHDHILRHRLAIVVRDGAGGHFIDIHQTGLNHARGESYGTAAKPDYSEGEQPVGVIMCECSWFSLFLQYP